MNRPYTFDDIKRLLEMVHSVFDDTVTLRTTFITGFPGETDKDFDTLKLFIENENRFDYIGVFDYSKEEKTDAARMKQIPENVRKERMSVLQETSVRAMDKRLQRFVGVETDILIEDILENSYSGRAVFQAPEIDGITFIEDKNSLKPGDIVKKTIKSRQNIDFTA
jgi:ribosomal protein S12 methylthiotransferase